MPPRDWTLVLTASLGLAVVSLASNITTTSQLAGDADTLLTVRSTLSKLVNSGTVWAGLGILSGWLVGRPVRGAVAGVVASLLALVAHYGLGRVTGVFGPDIWASNASWFVAAAVLGGPLGVVGAIGRRVDRWGLAARLVVPAAAVLEPFVSGMFAVPSVAPQPDRIASTVCGVVLLVAGVAAGAHLLRRRIASRRPPGAPTTQPR